MISMFQHAGIQPTQWFSHFMTIVLHYKQWNLREKGILMKDEQRDRKILMNPKLLVKICLPWIHTIFSSLSIFAKYWVLVLANYWFQHLVIKYLEFSEWRFLGIFDVESKKFCLDSATCSALIPTLKRIRDYLKKTSFDPCVSKFIVNLIESNNERIKNLKDNKTLHIATLLDPRFAYSPEIWKKIDWDIAEDELLEEAKKCLLHKK